MESGRFLFGCNGGSNMLIFGSEDEYFRDNMEETSKRRHFLSSFDDLSGEDLYNEHLPIKKRHISPEQAHMLEMSFEEENKLEPERKTDLAKKLGLQPRQVAIWFQNRRARWKTKTLERDYDRLKSSYHALVSDFDSIIKENEKLKAQVVSLTETLQSQERHQISTTGQNSDPSPAEVLPVKVEDHFYSGGSAMVDDLNGPQQVESGDSDLYWHSYDYSHEHVAPIDRSDDDGGSDDGRSYFPNAYATTEHHHVVEEEAIGWWIWS